MAPSAPPVDLVDKLKALGINERSAKFALTVRGSPRARAMPAVLSVHCVSVWFRCTGHLDRKGTRLDPSQRAALNLRHPPSARCRGRE